MSYHRKFTLGDVGLPPLPDLPAIPAPPPAPSESSGTTIFEDMAESVGKIFGGPKPLVKPAVPLPARPGMSTTAKLALAGGALALIVLVTRR